MVLLKEFPLLVSVLVHFLVVFLHLCLSLLNLSVWDGASQAIVLTPNLWVQNQHRIIVQLSLSKFSRDVEDPKWLAPRFPHQYLQATGNSTKNRREKKVLQKRVDTRASDQQLPGVPFPHTHRM